MIPASFDESNCVLDKPEGMTYDEVEALSVWRGYSPNDGLPLVISCWKPTQKELDEISRTGRVWLLVAGETMPPAALYGRSPFEEEEE